MSYLNPILDAGGPTRPILFRADPAQAVEDADPPQVYRRVPVIRVHVSLLARSHLRGQAPLPTTELAALKRSVAEVGAIGRNINRMVWAIDLIVKLS
jgi:hypothetical protein